MRTGSPRWTSSWCRRSRLRNGSEACGWDQAHRYLIRDLDGAYGEIFTRKTSINGHSGRSTPPRLPMAKRIC
jgi:hypothetical protein